MEMSKFDAPRGLGTNSFSTVLLSIWWMACFGLGTAEHRGKLQLGPRPSRGWTGRVTRDTQVPKRLCRRNGADGCSARENSLCHPVSVCVVAGAEEPRCLAEEGISSSRGRGHSLWKGAGAGGDLSPRLTNHPTHLCTEQPPAEPLPIGTVQKPSNPRLLPP